MPTIVPNPHRAQGGLTVDCPVPSHDAAAVARLLQRCPAHRETPLRQMMDLAARIGVDQLWIKDESARMGLGSFKALGAAYVIARDAAARGTKPDATSLTHTTYVTASAGNHGLSVAAGAAIFGAKAVIYLADTVPEAFADRLRAKGAKVMRAGVTYEDSMQAAFESAQDNGWTLLSDSTWDGYIDQGHGVMEGYTQMAAEMARQVPQPPTHLLLQAGVGGLAGAIAAYARQVWGEDLQIIVVEPDAAPALLSSILNGKPVTAPGPVSDMGRLDCKTPSLVALAGLSRDANSFVAITEDEAHHSVRVLADNGVHTTPSGGAGIAALLAGLPQIDATSRVLTIVSEGPEDG
ncbi:MAG: pyridoxal-phosphate dependent enzyme [Paracoccaceae bacterium]